jgi:hypothetical protein
LTEDQRRQATRSEGVLGIGVFRKRSHKDLEGVLEELPTLQYNNTAGALFAKCQLSWDYQTTIRGVGTGIISRLRKDDPASAFAWMQKFVSKEH